MVDIHILLIPLLLLAAAIFAAAEASLLSLSREQMESFRKRPQVYARIRNLISKPEAFLSTLIIGNELLSILLATLITTLLNLYYHELGLKVLMLISVLLSSTLLLMFSEIFPKTVAFRYPTLIAPFLSYPLSWAHYLLTPLRFVFLFFSQNILRLFGVQPVEPTVLDEKDFLTLVELGEESGSVDESERQMIFNVFRFSDLPVSSMMTPWNKVFHLDEDLNRDQVIQEIRKQNYSRIPIFSKPYAKVIGILYTKELLKILIPKGELLPDDWKKAVFQPYIVTQHQKASKLLTDFKQKKVHIALVVNEFGKQVGIITLEDILNSLIHQKKIQDKVQL